MRGTRKKRALTLRSLLEHDLAVEARTYRVVALDVARLDHLRGRGTAFVSSSRERVHVLEQIAELRAEALDFFVGQCDAREFGDVADVNRIGLHDKLRSVGRRRSEASVSTCPVCGNMSNGCTASRAISVGRQELQIPGERRGIARKVPDLRHAGRAIAAERRLVASLARAGRERLGRLRRSAIAPVAGSHSLHAAFENRRALKPLQLRVGARFARPRASSPRCRAPSAPWRAKNSENVPAPQYRSTTARGPGRSAVR